MDRAAFVFWAFATIAIIDIGLISMPIVLAHKGFKPRLGLILGPIIGLVMALLAIFAVKPLVYLILDGTQSVFSAAFDEDREIIRADWDNGGTRAIVWTDNDTVSLYNLSQISSPSRYHHEEGDLEHVELGPDQQSMLTWGTGDAIELWTVIDTTAPYYYMRHDSTIVDAVWNSDSENPKVLSWTENNTAYVWTVTENLDVPLVLRTNDELLLVTWGEDESTVLLWYTDNTVRIWDIEDIAAGQRFSTVETLRERNPALALNVQARSPAYRAGLRRGDTLVRAEGIGFNLDDIIDEAGIDTTTMEPSEIQRALSGIIDERLTEAFVAALPNGEMQFDILRDGETLTITVRIPEVSATNRSQEFSDFGTTVNYVGENPKILSVGDTSGDITMPPWSPERDLVMSWSIDNAIRVFEVNEPDNVLSLPYSDLPVVGALWGNNNEEVIFWTEDEAFAWNLDDENVGFRSTEAGSIQRRAGFIVSGDGADVAGVQAGDVLVSIAGVPVDANQLIADNNIEALTTRQYNRALAPIVIEMLARAAVAAGAQQQATFQIEVYRAGEIITLDIPVTPNDPTANPEPNPPLFPALSLTFLSEDTLGISSEFINENPRSLPVSGRLVSVAVGSENDYIALLTEDNKMYVWSLQTAQAPIELEGVTHAVWNGNGTHLLTWQDDTTEATVWLTEDIDNPVTLQLDHAVVNGIWSPADTSFVLVEDGSDATVWSIEDLTAPIATLDHDGNIQGASWSPDERRNQLLTYLDNGFFYSWVLETQTAGDAEEQATVVANSTPVELNTRTTIADDLKFDVSFASIIPEFDVLGARTRTLEFVRALLAGIITFIGGYWLLMTVYRFIPNRSDDNLSLGQRDMSAITIARQMRGSVLQIHYFISIVVGMVALSALMWNILKGTFTITAVSQTIDPMTLTDGRELGELEKDELTQILIERVEPRELRTQVRNFVWGVNEQVASAEGEGLDPLGDTTLESSLPDGIRMPEDITYAELRDESNYEVLKDLLAQNTDKNILDRLAVVTGLDRDDLAELLFDTLGPEGTRDFIVQQNIWPEINANPDEVYDWQVLQTELNLANRPPDGITFNTLTDYPDLLLEAVTATGPSDAISRSAIENTLIDLEVARINDIDAMDRAALADGVLAVLGAEGTRDFIDQQAIWIEFAATPDIPYDPVELHQNLELSSLPPEGVTYDTLPEYPDILLEVLSNEDLISELALQEQLIDARGVGIDTTPVLSATAIDVFNVTKPAPLSVTKQLVTQLIGDNVQAQFGSIASSRLREIFRIYTWQVSEEAATQVADDPLLDVSELAGFPKVPADLDFVYLQYDPEAMGYILEENLNVTDLETIVFDLVVQPFVVSTWTLDFLVQRELFGSDTVDKELEALNEQRAADAEENGTVWNDAEIEYRSWINFNFLRRTLNADAELTGMRNAILGTLWIIVITVGFAFPIGIGAAVYLEEYAGESLIKRVIQTNIDNLAGVPSIIYGLLGVTLFVRALESITSGTIFGYGDPTTANGRTILSAALTLGLLILPLIIINAQEAIRAIQPSIRQASFGLGATKWQTVWNHVLPYAMPGILTGTILAMSRAIGETAPLVVVGAATFIVQDPDGPFSKFTALPMQIYFWTSQPRDADKAVAAAAIAVLLTILISLNSFAIILRNRFEKQVRG